MDSLYLWIKFIHVVAGFTFIMGHGVSVALAFRIQKETEIDRVQAMFNLSGSMWPVYMLSWLVLMVAGIVNGFMRHWWSSGWIWVGYGGFLLILWLMIFKPF